MTGRNEHLEKVRRVRAWVKAHGYEAALLTSQNNFSWITAGGNAHVSLGDESAVAYILVTPDHVLLLTNVIEKQRVLNEELVDIDVVTQVWPWHDARGFDGALSKFCRPTQTVVDRLGLGGLRFDPRLAEVRYTLLPPEVDRYRRLSQDAALVVESVCRACSPGMTELQVAGLVARSSLEHGILTLVNLVAADERMAMYRHPIPTSKRITESAMVALTGRRHGLHVSLTRLVAFGKLDGETKRRHEAVARVDAAYILGSLPGRALKDVLEDGLAQYRREGFPDEWELHHQGGLTGYQGREVFATPVAEHALDAGQALAWNPSITGTKSEDTIIVTDDTPEILSQTKDWPPLEVELNGRRIHRPAILLR